MLNKLLHPFASATTKETAPPPRYRADLVATLRDEQKLMLAWLERSIEIEHQARVGRQAERLQELFGGYHERERDRLYPFLEHYAEHFETDDGPLIRENRRTVLAVAQQVTDLADQVTNRRKSEQELAALEPLLRTHFQRQQQQVYPLYHRYGIRLMRFTR